MSDTDISDRALSSDAELGKAMDFTHFVEKYEETYAPIEQQALIDQLFAATSDVKTLRNGDESALAWAIRRYREDVAITLVKGGAALDEPVGGKSLLYAAADQGMPRLVRAVLDSGVSAADDALRIVGKLLARQDRGKSDDDLSASTDVLRRLIRDANAAPNGCPLIADTRSARGARILIELGADPSAISTYEYHYGKSALHRAAEQGDLEVVDILLRAGAKPNVLDKNKKTAAKLAMTAGHAVVAARIDPAFSTKLFAGIEKKRLGGRAMPRELIALWTDALAGDTAMLDAVGELTLLSPDEESLGEDVERLGVPKKTKGKLCWVAREADGGLIGFFAEKAAPLEGSVVMIDNEGQVRAYGQTLAEFLVMRGDELDEASNVAGWLEKHGLVPSRSLDQIVAAAKTQPMPKLG